MERLYTLQEVAKYLGLSDRTIYRYIKSGKLKAVKVIDRWSITQSDLDAFIENRK